ncbi:MAG: hypothetical protein ACTSSH_01155, partial [Candidatus Heimdallarchaeota archaeon]
QTIVSVDSTDDSWRPEIAITSEDLLHVVWHDRTLNYGGSGADIDILHSYGPIPIATPNLSFTNQPLELVFAFESKEQSITWTISDRNVTLPTYTIYQNGTINRTDTWITDVPVFFSLTNLAIANYTIRIEASDGWGEVISNEVLVVIRQATNLWLDPLINSLLGLISAVMAVTVTTLIVIMIRQRKAVK